ncbi:hypothetical protein [Actinomadura violacea]|uniref:Uncharacterized protein n=1 Tax=Actinomadura violacea TaxID=2819934 RepID=A0ABS3RRP8_9ACTN|nr:hypothetical protein [Actinomadura violacea]MBO2459402.1 hypothetical protein [Actinomadura violacea]
MTAHPPREEKYESAKSTYRKFQNKEVCYKLTTSADEACWQKGRESISVIARRGYTVIKADYTASSSPDLKDQRMEGTAQSLAKEMLLHLHS